MAHGARHQARVCAALVLILLEPAGAVAATSAPDTVFIQEVSPSPDGRTFLLSLLDIQHGYRGTIVEVNADGSGFRKLADGPKDQWTSWSPDGMHFAFSSVKDANLDVYVMDADGANRIRLTTDPAEDTHPSWSRDGSKIAFISKRDSVAQVYVMQPDGSGQRALTGSPGQKWNPRWSPNGRSLVYFGAVERGKDSVYVLETGGARPKALAAGVWPSWSPDGSRILFSVDEDVFEMGADGSNPHKLFGDAIMARWAPDGKKIAVVRATWRHPKGWPAITQVFLVNPDGSAPVQITGELHLGADDK